jgi:alkylhydroperoxidase family enzyme
MSAKALTPIKVQKAVEALLTGAGTCAPALRQAVEAHAASLSMGSQLVAQDVPADLVAYVEKVVLHAYQITDQDVQALKDAGYSEDAVFEVTLCASVGASLARLERGLAAVNGDQACA